MKKLFKLLAVALSVCLMSGLFTACGGNKGVLKIGITYYEPMNYMKDGKLVGFETDFAKKVCEDLGYKAEFVEINWDNKIISLNAKEIDCIWNGMTVTPELQAAIGISNAYLTNRQVAVMKKTNKDTYTSKESLATAKVAVEAGSAGEKALKGLTVKEIIKAEAQKDTLLEVKSGAVEVAIVDFTLARSMTGEGTSYTDLCFVELDFTPEVYAIGVRKKDTELLKKLNESIAKVQKSGFLAEIAKTYDLTDLLVK